MTMTSKNSSGQQDALTHNERLILELRERKQSGKYLKWEDFSFERSQERLKDVPGNLSDAVIEERNA